MAQQAVERLNLVVCCSPGDRELKEELETHLCPLMRGGVLEIWSTDDIAPGGVLAAEFQHALAHADVALLLLSAEFFVGSQIQDNQLPLLLLHQQQGLRLIPIIARACDWQSHAALAQLKPLPADGTALSSLDRPRRELAMLAIARQLAALPGRPGRSLAAEPLRPALASPSAPFSPAIYLPHPDLESRALRLLATPGQPAVLWGPERCGKSWLLKRLLDRTHEQDGDDSRFILIHLGQLLDRAVTLDAFYRLFAEHLVDALDRDPDYSTHWPRWVAEAWEQFGVPMRKLKWLVQHHLLPRCPQRLVMAIDGADAVIGAPWHSDFYGMLRGWAEAAHTTEFARLRIVLAVSTAPALLISHAQQSPFNLTQPLVMAGFDEPQLAELARRYCLPLSAPEITLLRVRLGGHPYLSRLCLFAAARDGLPLIELLEPQRPASQQLFAEFLNSYRERLYAEPTLHAALRAVARPAAVPPEPKLTDRLARAGLVVREGAGYRLYCPLYEQLL